MTIDPGLTSTERDILLELSTVLSERESIGEAFPAFARLLLGPTHADFALLSLIEADGRLITVAGVFPEGMGSIQPGAEFRSDLAGTDALDGLEGDAAAYRPVDIPFAIPQLLAVDGYQQAWSARLTVQGEQVCVFSIARRAEAAFEECELRLAREAARLLGAAAHHDLHSAALERQAVRSSLLNDLAVLLNAGEDVNTLFGRMLELLGRAIVFDYILLFARTGSELRLVGEQPQLLVNTGYRVPLNGKRVQALLTQVDGVLEYRVDRLTGPWMEALARHGGCRGLVSLLRDGDELLGVFTLGRNRNVPFKPEERAFVGVVTTLLKQAIANEHRLHQVEMEAARGQLLNELSLKLSDGESVEALFAELPVFLGRALQFDYVGLAAFGGPDGKMRTLTWLPGAPAQSLNSTVDPEAIGFSAMTRGTPPVHEIALEGLTGGVARQFFESGFRRSAVAKLQNRGHLVGVLHLSRLANVPFGADGLAFLEVVATLFAQAVASRLRFERSLTEATKQRLVAEISAGAARERDAAALLGAMVPPLRSAIPEVALAFLFVEGDHLLYCDAEGARIPLPEGVYARSVLEGSQVVISAEDPAGSAAALALARAEGVVSFVMTPALSGGEVVGMFVVGTRRTEYTFSKADLELLSTMAQVAGPAMATVLAGEQLAAEAREQRVVAEIAAIAAREDSLPKLVASLWQPLRQLVPRPFLAFGFLDGEELVFPRETGAFTRAPLDVPTRKALREGQVHGTVRPGELTGNFLETYGVHAAAVTAARSGGEITGLLLTGSLLEGYEFGERELRLFRLIAQVVGPAMVNARAADRSRVDAEDQGVLADIGTAVAREAGPLAILQGAVEPLRRIIPQPLLGFGAIEDGFSIYEVPGIGEVKLPLTAIEEQVMREGQVVSGPLGPLLPEGHHGRLWGVQSAVGTARYMGGKARGILIVGSRAEGFTFGERERHLCRRILQIIGPAMETARAATIRAQQAALYDLVLSSLTEGVVLLDDGGRIVFANPAAARLRAIFDPLRATAEVGRVLPLLPAEMRKVFHQATHKGRPVRVRSALQLEGEEHWFDFEFVPLDGPALRLLIVAADVTAAVRREEQESRHRDEMAHASRLAALGELVGGVAHELNNPLTAILGFAEVSQLSPAGESLHEELAVIQKEALRARNIVRDLLFIARPGPGERKQVDFGGVVAHIERLRRAEWARAGIEVEFDLPSGPYDLRGNENQLTQLMLNLVTNAEQALVGRDHPRITITAQATATQLQIAVRDNGLGMDPATVRRVFEPFFTTKQGLGTGLGMSLSYSIVTSHNGTIDVESAPGQGATFYINLPLEEGRSLGEAVANPDGTKQRARVLVIDDEPSLRKVCQRLVASMGHECEVAGDSETALRLALDERKPFDLVLCDYRLRSDTADTVIEALAARRPALLSCTVIATGAASDAGVVDIVSRHHLRLVAKPYGSDEISALLADTRRIEPLSA